MLDGTSRLSFVDGSRIQHFNFISCFAEHAVVPAASAVPIPRTLAWSEAALLGCGAVTGFGAVRNAAGVAAGESVCVVGCGGVGLQVVAAARLAGADPIVAVDVDATKLQLATARGASQVIQADGPAAVAAVRELVGGEGVDHAFEVAGRPETIRAAFDVLRPGATAIVVGISPRGADVSLPAQEFLSEKGIRGTYYGSGDPARDLSDLAELAVAGTLDLDGVVSHVTDLAGVEEAFERLRRGEGARTVVLAGPSIPSPS
jgi:S-(hydroxymethyl)glutathione dehydrogenase/alcohol dehydrogenase